MDNPLSGIGKADSFNPSIGLTRIQTAIVRNMPPQTWMFQSLNRAYSHSDNPVIGTDVSPKLRFNPSIGLTRIQTQVNGLKGDKWLVFQSLNRAYSHSDGFGAGLPPRTCGCFNPSIGLTRIQTIFRKCSLSLNIVSIPQSGLLAFRQIKSCGVIIPRSRFNPSIGLTRIQTKGIRN